MVPDQVIAAIWENARRAIDENIEGFADVAQHRLASIALESIERKKDNLTDDIIGFIGSIGREAIKRHTSLVRSCIDNITMLGELIIKEGLTSSTETTINILTKIVEESIEGGKREIADECLNELFKIIDIIPIGLLEEQVGRSVCRRLFKLGVLFTAHQCEEKQNEIIKRLKDLETILSTPVVIAEFNKIPKYWSDKREKQIIQFRKIYGESSKE